MNSGKEYPPTIDCSGAYEIMMEAIASGEEMDEEDEELLTRWEQENWINPSWRKRYQHICWDLRRVPVDDLWVSEEFFIDEQKISGFVNFPSNSFPPLLIDKDGHPLDGQHRLLAAQTRGDEYVWAYMPRAA